MKDIAAVVDCAGLEGMEDLGVVDPESLVDTIGTAWKIVEGPAFICCSCIPGGSCALIFCRAS